MPNSFLIFLLLFLQNAVLSAQKVVSITIDDVPNTNLYQQQNHQAPLLQQLEALQIPTAIFINEGLLYKTTALSQNFDLLHQWIKSDYTTLGNHTFSHSRYSTTGPSFFSDILKGAYISTELAQYYNKTLHHFRFPYNDLGKDSLQQAAVEAFLRKQGYQTTPFTIESSDWLYNYVYKYYWEQQQEEKAKEIGQEYVTKTLAYFDFFETLAFNEYHRPIKHIYLCHDNLLNAHYLPLLIKELQARNYQFISLDAALQDPIYQQPNYYYKKWGISWLYRWKPIHKERIELLQQEPSTEAIQALYERILKEK
ncbi:MAG: polysaccharide deacetylase family protein [Aureispira sp.]